MSATRSARGTERFFDIAPELLCIADAEGIVHTVNGASRPLLGLEPRELEGNSLAFFVFEEDVAAADAFFRDLDADAPTATTVLRFRVGDGDLRRIRWSVRLDPTTELRYAMAWDVTEKQRAQTRYRAATEASPTALLMVDDQGRIVLANQASLRLLGHEAGLLLGQPIEALVPPEARAKHPRLRKGFQRQPAVRAMGEGRDLTVVSVTGEWIPVEIGLSPVRVDGEVHTVVSLVDVTERNRKNREIQALADELQKANASLAELAVTDALTGIWNRRKFLEEAERFMKLMQQTGGPFSIIIADIDDFKTVNDRFGHLAGDQVLRNVAGVMKEVRSGSDFTARFGGEEFIIGLPGAGGPRAEGLAERLRVAVEELPWESAPVTVSAGVATVHDLGERGTETLALLEHLIDRADQALYRSKAEGKNRVTRAEDL